MTTTLFLMLLTILSIASGLVTQALKQAIKSISTNVIALVDAIVVGGGGSTVAFALLGIPFTPVNIICIILLAFCVWIGSMVGFDKVKQTVEQIIAIPK